MSSLYVYFVNSPVKKSMSMLKKLLILFLVSVTLAGCEDPVPVVIDVPIVKPPVSKHVIDTYYYVQFAWGKNQDTITLEVPDDTSDLSDFDYHALVRELKSEPIIDTTDKINIEWPEVDTVGWHYAPGGSLMPDIFVQLMRSEQNATPEEAEAATKNIITISFPYEVKGDTLPYWDISDYLVNPSLVKGPVKWGRVGNNIFNDTIWNQDVQAGAMISFIDDQGRVWESDNHPTFQPFGYFELTQVIYNNRDGRSYGIIQGEFAVRLYNELVEYKDMRDGKFRIRILGDIELSPQPE